MSRKGGLAFWVAVGFGSGLSPLVAGTVGTIPVWVAVFLLGQKWPPSVLALSLAALVVTWIGIWAASRVEPLLGHDPKAVVIDEWAGMLIALIAVPVTVPAYLYAFFLFRLFDVVKPPPARQMEKLPGGYGVVFDDLVAGLYALAVFHLTARLFPNLF